MPRERKPTRREYRDGKYGTGYDAFRTGLTFREAVKMMTAPAHDPSKWRKCRNRRAVLGFMHEIKLQWWHQYQDATSTTQEG